jgi:hypothetical protein
MTLKPTDMLEIQTAIDEYERKFPRRPAPTAEQALAWRLGKREWARRQAAEHSAQPDERNPAFAHRDSGRLVSVWEQMRQKWESWGPSEGLAAESVDTLPWVRKALLVGWWGLFAVLVASIFFLGAMVGGFK